ncbi:MAG: MoxR family ATPase [Gammaproteobacteria bacterium]|jgi:MoxR-like ATPase|nr:MoxR family ATPase [Pseudomonadota bacterium]MCZ6732364.1 MoxR family ATPase [Gammaproteobacteria bacterium]
MLPSEKARPITDLVDAQTVFQNIASNIGRVIKDQSGAIRKLLAAFASGGHVLLEDYPGTGKTTLAKTLACSINGDFQRIQFTPDLLPSDIIGVSIYDQKEQAFNFHRGPVFTQILLADEINRASPRTQSALLEAMGENQVSVDGTRYQLDDLFFVVATQNPVEFHGTYPLPEAQMDRFGLRFQLGYVDAEQEVEILTDQRDAHPLASLNACAGQDDVKMLRRAVPIMRISDEIKRYIVDIVAATRSAQGIKMGASPRASLTMMKTAQALALFDGLEFVTPDHVQELAVPVLAHRVVIDPQAHFSGRTAEAVIKEVVTTVPAPV